MSSPSKWSQPTLLHLLISLIMIIKCSCRTLLDDCQSATLKHIFREGNRTFWLRLEPPITKMLDFGFVTNCHEPPLCSKDILFSDDLGRSYSRTVDF
ncbi:hypothetical protein V6Z12_A06G073300 [Gossypium hirsutum]